MLPHFPCFMFLWHCQCFNSLRTDGDFCHRRRDTQIAQNIYDCRNMWPFTGMHFLSFSQ
jgi:hypothetical protein